MSLDENEMATKYKHKYTSMYNFTCISVYLHESLSKPIVHCVLHIDESQCQASSKTYTCILDSQVCVLDSRVCVLEGMNVSVNQSMLAAITSVAKTINDGVGIISASIRK